MAILSERAAWRKPRDPKATRRSSDLTPEERANVRRALRFLRTRLGGGPKLAAALRVNPVTLRAVLMPRGRPVSAGLAIRAARMANVSVEGVLTGVWPLEGACPVCGRHA